MKALAAAAGSLRVLHAAAAALSLLALAACSDGYPTDDVPLLDPVRMTQVQLLVALNELGDESHLGKRWRVALHDGCELELLDVALTSRSPLCLVMWRRRLAIGTVVNMLTNMMALIVVIPGGPTWAAVSVHLSPLPYRS